MKETQNIEFKRQWRDDFLAELCGFANAQGGTLYIGMDDKGNLVGIENAKQLLEKLPNLINQTMGLLASVNLMEEEGKEYLSVSVSAAEQPVSYRGILLPFGHNASRDEWQRFAKFFASKNEFVMGCNNSAKRNY